MPDLLLLQLPQDADGGMGCTAAVVQPPRRAGHLGRDVTDSPAFAARVLSRDVLARWSQRLSG